MAAAGQDDGRRLTPVKRCPEASDPIASDYIIKESDKWGAENRKNKGLEPRKHYAEVRQQLAEQVRCIEQRAETHAQLLGEVADYYRRRAECELEHARTLDKLCKHLVAKQRSSKRETYRQHTTHDVWEELLIQTRNESRQHAALSELYAAYAVPAIHRRQEDMQRVTKKCREVAYSAHEEISRVLRELHSTMRTYQVFYAEHSHFESKFQTIKAARAKFETEHPNKVPNSRKYKQIQKDYAKRQAKYAESAMRSLRARNEYFLCVDAANAALTQYYAHDLHRIMDCADMGAQEWLSHLINTVVNARKSVAQSQMNALAELAGLRDSIDPLSDRDRFISAHHSTFELPRKFEFRPHHADKETSIKATEHVQEELGQRLWQIQKRLSDLRREMDELLRSLNDTHAKIVQLQCMPKIDFDELLHPSASTTTTPATTPIVNGTVTFPPTSPSVSETPAPVSKCRLPRESEETVNKRKAELIVLEDEYIAKYRAYVMTANLIKRLQARGHLLRQALDGRQVQMTLGVDVVQRDTYSSLSNTRRRIGGSVGSRPKLFGGSVDEYCAATGDDIPLIVRSCVRMLSRHGLHHQGVFRVSGSSSAIAALREAFERGDDALEDSTDVNGAAGVLKAYLRELRPPLFPPVLFTQLMGAAQLPNKAAFVSEMRRLLTTLSTPVLLLMRYLFAFLAHLSEFSDENMMDAHNLAICLGPTLLPIPAGQDQVCCHNYVAELVKNTILWHEEIFPRRLSGTRYTRYTDTDDKPLTVETTSGDIADQTLETVTSGSPLAEKRITSDSEPEGNGEMSELENMDDSLSHASNTAVVEECQAEQYVTPRPANVRNGHTLVSTTTGLSSHQGQGVYEPMNMQYQLTTVKISSEPPPSIPSSATSTPLSSRHQQQQLWMPLAGVSAPRNNAHTRSPPQSDGTHEARTEELLRHQGSPTIDEMQSELKAVLNALEHYSISHGAPDLVQNLPELSVKESSPQSATCTSVPRRSLIAPEVPRKPPVHFRHSAVRDTAKTEHTSNASSVYEERIV